MNILVTGGFGFIGSNFINFLINKEEVSSVSNVDVSTYASDFTNVKVHPKVCHYIKDINNTSFVSELLKENNITHLVHFAAESHVDNSISNPDSFIQTNINGTFSLLEAAKKYGNLERFHHVSTDEVYGSLGPIGFFTESTPYSPRSPYSASKAASDHLVRAYHHTYGMNVTVSNCSNNYGPNQHLEKLIPKIITNLKQNKKVPIYGNGQNVRDWLYVEDHCEAIWKVLLKGKSGDTYNIGGDCELNNLQLTKTICSLMNKDSNEFITFVEDRKGHDFRYAINFNKIHNELGWIPKTNFEVGIKKTIEYYSNKLAI